MKRYIKSSSEPDGVFMLMNYIPDSGEGGMAGDQFYCEGKFFAPSLASAKSELLALKKKYPRLQNYYVTEYDEDFDSMPESESDIDMNPSAWGGVEYNVFADLETLIQYQGLEGPIYPDDDDTELPFTI